MFGKFSAFISLSKFSVPFFLFFPSGTPIIQIFASLMESDSSHWLSLLFFSISSLSALFLYSCTPGHLTLSSMCFTLLRMLSIIFFISSIEFFSSRISVWVLFYHFNLFGKELLVINFIPDLTELSFCFLVAC